jgi:hypothetical protein
MPHFQTTPESQKALDNLVLAARARSTIFDICPAGDVVVEDGIVTVHTEGPIEQEGEIQNRIGTLLQSVAGVREARVHVRPSSFV